ncbi:uncharacterized protein LOC100126633 precursor [Xenopus laevis]|uniref:LOC100126633 protein n=1 Tax=Xenopus laevis TaxID=8355 RepID=A8E5Z8_XENLA|nr:uncharacterized protein LOC100126633 precursor [Xenopus laevis]AAI53778.1 LOC100126633 protein [Xenopus laevis]
MKTFLGFLFLTLCWDQIYSQYASSCSDCNSYAVCDDRSGFVYCSCKSGYIGNGFNCTPITSCGTSPCCPQGYSWDIKTKTCVDINECSDPVLNKCSPPSTCANRNGIYLCANNRNSLCPTSVCGIEQDCVSIGGAPQCADPCDNYKELNGTSRLSTIDSSGRFQTDRFTFGWTRYVGKVGVSMKQGCVGALKCGSAEPFTLGGQHPALGEGVKMVPLQVNRKTGCTPGASIPVKACPGGYYVYKFSGSVASEVFCTDPTTTPTTLAPTTLITTTSATTTTTTPSTTSASTTSTAPLTTTTIKSETTTAAAKTSAPFLHEIEGSGSEDNIVDIFSTNVPTARPSTTAKVFCTLSSEIPNFLQLLEQLNGILKQFPKGKNITGELSQLHEKVCNIPIDSTSRVLDQIAEKVADAVGSLIHELVN